MHLTRRQFFLASGSAAALWPVGRSELCADGEILQLSERTSRALGSDVSISVLHCDPKFASAALTSAFDELELVEQLMSIYRPESQLSQLNRRGRLENPHPYFVDVLRAALDMSRRSQGAFDITVQPLWALYRLAQQQGELPEAVAIERAFKQVDWRQVDVSEKEVVLRGNGTAITLNGIAQGFAADRVAAELRRHGIRHALINTGEIGAIGRNSTGDPWRIGIQHPRRDDAYVSLARLSDRCLATSGDYATAFSADLRHHHIFDPHTGRSPEELASVSVVAPTAMEADAMSTAVLVLGPQRGAALIRSLAGTDAMLVTKQGGVFATEGFPIDPPT